jgi:O-antigen/teichoic acid export membrane protein
MKTPVSDFPVRGSASALLLRLAGAGMAFGLQVLLARLLGHAQYGVYIFAFTLIATLSLVLKLGFDTTMLRFLPGYRIRNQWELLRGLLRESSRLVWAAAGGVAILIAAVAGLVRPGADAELAWTFCIAGAALPLMATQHLAEARLRAFDRLTLARIPPELLQPLLLGLIVVAFMTAQGGIRAPAAMFCTLVAAALTLLVSTLAFRSVAPAQAFSGPVRRDSRRWRTASLLLAAFSTTMLVIGQIDVVVAGAMMGPEVAGSYATASRISKFIPFGLTAVNLALAPLASRLFHEGRTDELQRVVVWAAGAILLTTLPLAAGVILFGTSLLGVFGPEFVVARDALVILSIGKVVNALCGPTATLLAMSGNQRELAAVAVGSAALDGALLILLIPWLGMVGAAVATTLTTVAWNLALLYLVRRRTGIRPTLFALAQPGRRRPIS